MKKIIVSIFFVAVIALVVINVMGCTLDIGSAKKVVETLPFPFMEGEELILENYNFENEGSIDIYKMPNGQFRVVEKLYGSTIDDNDVEYITIEAMVNRKAIEKIIGEYDLETTL